MFVRKITTYFMLLRMCGTKMMTFAASLELSLSNHLVAELGGLAKMATLKELEKYLDYEFSTGEYTGQDYKTFQNKYINYLKTICTQNNWQLVNVGRNHYCFTAFVKDNERHYIYISISDVRYFKNKWYNNILIRTATDERDYRGGNNYYTKLPRLQYAIQEMFNKEI